MSLLTNCAHKIARGIRFTEQIFKTVGLVTLFALMLLGTADVAGRYFFNSPIQGTVETGRMMLMGIVVLGWAYTQATRSHVAVDFLVSRFSPRKQVIADFITSILSLGLFILISWQAIVVGLANLESGKYVMIIRVPVGIMDFVVALGAILISLELLLQVFSYYSKIVKKEPELQADK